MGVMSKPRRELLPLDMNGRGRGILLGLPNANVGVVVTLTA